MNNQRTKQNITRTPAPFLPGCYSLQAVSDRPGIPDITIYRQDAEAALAEKNKMSKLGLFSRFLLRSAEDAWDVYNAAGALEHLCHDVVYDHAEEIEKPIMVNRDKFDAEVAAVVGPGVSSMVCVECHSGGSSVEHSNFVVLAKTMIMAADAKDMECLYVAETHDYPCRVVGMYARMSEMSEAMVNKYLDRYEWLSAGLPLSNPHHALVLAKRIAQVRTRYLCELVAKSLEIKGASKDEQMYATFAIHAAPFPTRHQLANEVVQSLLPGLTIDLPGSAETFDEKALEENAEKVVAHYKALGI